MICFTPMLAQIDAATWTAIVIGGLGLLIAMAGLVVSLATYLRDRGKDLRTLVNEIIDARFAAFQAAQDEIQRRLERGDLHFDGLNERDRKLETALLSKLSDMKDWMHETFATKDDYQALGGRFDGFQRFIAKMETERKS